MKLQLPWLQTTGVAVLLALVPMPAQAAQSKTPADFTTYADETRNRAAVLLAGDALSAPVAQRLQERWRDEAAFFRPNARVADATAARGKLDLWLKARPWHVAILALPPGDTTKESYEQALQAIVRGLRESGCAVVWCSPPMEGDRANAGWAEDAARRVMQAAGAEIADWHTLSAGPMGEGRGVAGGWTEAGAERSAAALAEPLRRALFSRSTPWAELPPGERHNPRALLAEDGLFAAPMNLPAAPGRHAVVYRAEGGGWQFNLHSFLAHHDGRFWAVWSSGRVNEDSSSQIIRCATSADGFVWSEARVLAADPDGETGPWRWMASGVYSEGGSLYALGSLNQGNSPPGGPWSHARLVRFRWNGSNWLENTVVAENCVVYFPPLRVGDRDFFVWRDSRALFYTGHAPAGTNQWKVTRLPGPAPDYRMSETSAYADPEGVLHLIIRDQGYTRRLYHAVSYDAGSTWTIPVKTNYPDAVSKNMSGRLSNGWYYLINNPKSSGTNPRDPLAISFSRDGWTFGRPLALRKNAPSLRYPGGAKGAHSYQYSHAIEHDGQLWVIYATNKEDIEVSAYPIDGFGLPR